MYVLQKHNEITHMFEKEKCSVSSMRDEARYHNVERVEQKYTLDTCCIVHAFETYEGYKTPFEDMQVGCKRKCISISDFVTETNKLSAEYIDLQNEYIRKSKELLSPLFGNVFNDCRQKKKGKKVDTWNNDIQSREIKLKCDTCGFERFISESDATIICKECGTREEYDYDEHMHAQIGNDCDNSVPFSYQRISHFNGWLNQFQAKEKTYIEFSMLQELEGEFKRAGKKLDDITVQSVRQYLKKLSKKHATSGHRNSQYTKLYEHAAQIVHLLGGNPPPELTPLQEEKLRTMFRQIQEPFQIVKPQNRKNFLSYSYFFVKCTELLNWNELKKCFTLLKSREKLIAQDSIWKGICKILEWKFYPSV